MLDYDLINKYYSVNNATVGPENAVYFYDTDTCQVCDVSALGFELCTCVVKEDKVACLKAIVHNFQSMNLALIKCFKHVSKNAGLL